MDSKVALSLDIGQPLDLASTLESGQTFRWQRRGEWYYGVLHNDLLALRQNGPRLEVRNWSSSPEQIEAALRDYLHLDDDLETIYSYIDTDSRMHEAISAYRGLRILRQDPWECLVSFICSANSNIPRISASMVNIAENYGRPLRLDDYTNYSFPTPKRLAEVGEEALTGLKLGFRAKYVARAAEKMAQGVVNLESLRRIPYQEAKDVLTSLAGVGDKVADCVLLFSLDKMDACPIDRWVRRAMEDWYLNGAKLNYKDIRTWALEKWGGYAGYAQQYLFHQRRLLGQGNALHPRKGHVLEPGLKTVPAAIQ
ncbi:MAG: DNA glycosylase [Dehalococcoidia bacterium]|jgi:N-glycosylase/DNA lyase|nr:DNA glycosylase [Dehalococcoidia bacterium]